MEVKTPAIIDINSLLSAVESHVKNAIDERLRHFQPRPEKPKQLLSVDEAAKEYGQTPSYWRKQVYNRSIPFVKMGKSVKLRRKDIEAFIAARTVEP